MIILMMCKGSNEYVDGVDVDRKEEFRQTVA